MAVTNFHYITRMSSGFKVYILEGQPNLRSEDRFRHMNSDRIRVIPAHPLKRKHNSERGRTLEERRERTLSNTLASAVMRPPSFSVPESPTSTWSPTASPTYLIPSPAHSTPVMDSSVFSTSGTDEPLALIKKPRQERENIGGTSKLTAIRQKQIRPSVITCVSSMKSAHRTEDWCGHTTVLTEHTYDHVEEHFQRSLGVNYQKASTKPLSISVSVDDHFAKALGETWLQLKASSSSSPPSNTIFIHSSAYGQSPTQVYKDSFSSTTTTHTSWLEKCKQRTNFK